MGVRIVQGPVWSYLDAPLEIISKVHAAMAVKSPTARFSKAARYGQWDGMVKFVRLPKGTFQTGLTERVREECLKHVASPIDVVIQPVRSQRKAALALALEGVTLRDYQRVAVEQFLVGQGARGTLEVPTGGGKTEIGLEIVRRLGQNTLWLTHLKDIMAQTIERANKRLPKMEVGQIGNGVMKPMFPLTVAMVQTLKDVPKKDPFWDAWRMVVFDECHHTSANTWYEVAQQLRYAPFRLGLSGTASTKDIIKDMRLEGVTGPVIKVVSTEDLVEAGFLAKPTIYLLRPPAESYNTGKDYRHLDARGAERFQAVYQHGIVENEHRNELLVKTAVKHASWGHKVLVLVTRVQHGEDLKFWVQQQHQWCEWLSGKEPLDRRTNVLNIFKTREQGAVLIASTIFDEGIDIPEIDTLILGGAGESSIRTMQRIGRAIRPRPDKDEAIIYDFTDGKAPMKGTKLAYDDYLASHFRNRLKDYEKENFKVVVAR